MIPAIQELNFPKKDGKQYATLSHATVNLADMDEKTITTQVKIDGDIVPDFSQDWEVAFQGEKYIMPLRLPQGAKENTSLNSTIDLTFQHWAIWQLKRWTFVTMQPIDTGTAVADEEVASVQLNLKDFCDLFGQVLRYYYGDTITIDLNPAWQYDKAPTAIEISHSYIWNVLIDAFHDKYGVRWAIEPREDNDNTVKGGERYVIKIGYPTTEVDHIFEYGFEGGLLKLERQVQSEDIRNMIKGRGGETNIPFRYFKGKDPNNPDFKPDPDWVEELANIYFTNLRGATFRSYVQGWKAAHISKYPGYKAVGENNAYAPWAYRKGFTDSKFHPEEFVADEITLTPEEGDRQVEILPGYSPYIKKGSSIDKYGPLPATLDNNDDIYPTIQGTGLDIAVDVEQIESDDVAESTESDAQVRTLPAENSATVSVAKTSRKQLTIKSQTFLVEAGKYANLDEGVKSIALTKDGKKWVWNGDKTWRGHVETFQIPVEDMNATIENAELVVINPATGAEVSASGIPGGITGTTYSFLLRLTVYNTTDTALNVTVTCPSPKLTHATLSDKKWKNTFDIWVKNIWSSSKRETETATQYAERVWKPILGDREGNTAKVVFTSGMLVHEDYEFTIVDFPVLDTSKTYTDKNGITHDSHWRITLAKSDAELEATGLYVPSTKKQGKAGDTFAFVGTEMTHIPYVVDAEIRLDDWKKDHLGEVKEIKPTFVVTTDRVRLNNEGKPNALINQLRAGNSLRIADKRFIQPMGDRAYETLYLQSLTYTYREPSNGDAALNPDVEIVLSNEYTTSANVVSIMQGDISTLQRQVGSISNIEQIVRAIGDKLYLRKDGISDRSLSPTQFFSLLTSGDFRAGIIGGAGWGFFKDENDSWVLETDRLSVRQDMSVNSLVINQAEGRGGMEIDTAAFMQVTRVDDTPDGCICYFDQREGSVGNLFHVDDVAFCNQWTPENQELKFYKRRVIAVGVDNITLTKGYDPIELPDGTIDTGVNGTGIPAEGDNIIHYGNYTDKTRQYVKVRDVVGGGYERYIEELNSVNAAGVEYYFVGKQMGESRWFVGHKDEVPYSGKGDGSYIEYLNRRFNLNNVTLSVNTTIGDKSLSELLEGFDASEYLRKALPQNTEVIGGVILSSQLALGYVDDEGCRHTLAGMNGVWDTELGGRTIASWWGGNAVDLFDRMDVRLDPIPADGAKSLVRMDGSAYFANGNIGFKADGSGWLGNDVNGIKFSSNGSMTFGNGIRIALSGGEEGLSSTLQSLLNIAMGLTNLVVPINAAGEELSWAEAIDVKAVKVKTNLLSVGEIVNHAADDSIGGTGGVGGSGWLGAVELGTLAVGDALVWDGTKWTNGTIAATGGINEAELASYLTTNNYITSDYLINKFVRLTGDTMTGMLSIAASAGDNFNEGIRLHAAPQGWTSLVFCASDNAGNEGTSANTWAVCVNNGAFGIGRKGNGILDGDARLWCDTSNNWHFSGGTNITYNNNSILHEGNYASILDSRYVNAAGDTMTGALNVAHNSTCCIINTHCNSTGAYTNVLWADPTNNHVVYGSPRWSKVTLETSSDHIRRQTGDNFYKIWDSGNDGEGSGLDADLLDGYQGSSYLRSYFGNIDCSVFHPLSFCSFTYNNNAPFIGGFVDISAGGYGFYLGTQYHSDAPLFYRRHGLVTDGGMGGWQQLARITDNVASATKLQTARNIWGQSFDGSGNISGRFELDGNTDGCLSIYDGGTFRAVQTWYLMPLVLNPQGNNVGIGTTSPRAKLHVAGDLITNSDYFFQGYDGTLRIYSVPNPAQPAAYESETVVIQTAFDQQDPKTSNYPSLYQDRVVLALQPRGGRVGIGTAAPSCALHVVGDFLATGEITNHSDRRLKSDIAPIVPSGRLSPVTYYKDGRRQVGLIAQDVQVLCSDAVRVGDDPLGILSLNYNAAWAYGFAEVYTELDNHEERIKKLEREAGYGK